MRKGHAEVRRLERRPNEAATVFLGLSDRLHLQFLTLQSRIPTALPNGSDALRSTNSVRVRVPPPSCLHTAGSSCGCLKLRSWNPGPRDHLSIECGYRSYESRKIPRWRRRGQRYLRDDQGVFPSGFLSTHRRLRYT